MKKDFTFSDHVQTSPHRHRQVINYKGKEIGYLVTVERSLLAPLVETYLIPDVEVGLSEPTEGLLEGCEGWIEFKAFADYDEALKYAEDNFKDVSYLFEVGDYD